MRQLRNDDLDIAAGYNSVDDSDARCISDDGSRSTLLDDFFQLICAYNVHYVSTRNVHLLAVVRLLISNFVAAIVFSLL